MAATGCSRWYVCCGALEFAGLASALALGACATSVLWAASSGELREALRFCTSDEHVDVLVGEGLAEGDPLEAACGLAGLGRGRTVLCVQGAAGVAQACTARGVTAAVEPQGLVRLLVALHAEGLRRASAQGAYGQVGEASGSSPAQAADVASRGGVPVARPAAGGRADAGASGGFEASSAHAAEGRQASQGAVGGPAAPAAAPVSPAIDSAQGERPAAAPGASGAHAPGARGSGDGRPAGADPQATSPLPASRQVRSQGGVPVRDCEAEHAHPVDIDAIREPVVLAPVVHLSQRVECGVAGMDSPVPTLCVASARGGVGKSALAVVSALALARHGLNVSLIDLDFQFGTCLGYLGSGETDGLVDAAGGDGAVMVDARTLARCRCTPCRGLAAYEFCRMPEQAELLLGAAAQLVRAARAGSDVAVVDLPAGVNEAVAQAIELSDRCLFVADQGALSLESLSAQQSLCARLGIPRTKLVTVMNRCDPRHRDEGFLSRVSFETQAPQVVRVLDGGAEVTQMLSIGHAADLFGIQNRFAVSVEALMAQVCAALGVPGMEGVQADAQAPAAKAQGKAAKRRRKSEQQRQEEPCPF